MSDDKHYDLFNSNIGDNVKHAHIEFNGGKDGTDHQVVASTDGWHRSWDTDGRDNISRDHVTTHDDKEKYDINP